MKTSSAKAKGRNLQKWVVSKLVEHLDLNPDDLESRPMGSSGEDVIMGVQSSEVFPYSVEFKNQEKGNVWASYEQSEANCGKHQPLVVIKKNHKKPLVVVDAEYFIELHESFDWRKGTLWEKK